MAARSAMLVLLVFAPMAVEAARSARNERAQRARGGLEPPDDVYMMMRLAYPGAFLAMIAEAAARGGPSAAWPAGIAVFGAAKAIKWWAIATLGRCWTFRVIVVPGTILTTRGPYRWLRHPNYVGVIGELVGIAIVAGARVTGPIAVAAFGALILRRIQVEERWLDAILRRT